MAAYSQVDGFPQVKNAISSIFVPRARCKVVLDKY